MSNALAIATVTATLSDLITKSAEVIVPGAKAVVGRPQSTVDAGTHAVYVYLYHVVPHPGFRNDDLPTRSGEIVTKRPRFPLVLHYLLVFQGDAAQLEPERMLGAVVRDFHARPLLARTDIEAAISARTELIGSNLPQAFERVRLTQTPLTLEELAKLWSIFFQVPHAVSVAYEASLVELEADETPRMPRPVLYRGDGDRGVYLAVGPFPSIEAIEVAEGYPNATLGAQLIITGRHLVGSPLTLHFRHTRLDTPPITINIPPADSTGDRLVATIPSGPAANAWAAGVVEVTFESGKNDPPRLSNTVPVALAPTIRNIAPPSPIARDTDHNASITVTMEPRVRPEQRVSLLLDGSETVAPARMATTDTITFAVKGASSGKALVQVRVDGVDSMPFFRTGTPRVIQFDPAQQVTIV